MLCAENSFYEITGTLSSNEKMSDCSSPRNVDWPSAENKEVHMIGVTRAEPELRGETEIEYIKKGYSSGASSLSSGESEKQQHHRQSSDRLGLEDMKTALLTDGTLSTNVVRMEVRQEILIFIRSAICR
jgi:hypothetical protein